MNDQDASQAAQAPHLMKIQKDSEHKVEMQVLANSFAMLILKWYFLLNSGGLIGTLTLLSAKNGHYTFLCIILSVLFSLGLIFVIISCKLDHIRILSAFDKSIKNKPDETLVTIFEYLSIIFFILGLIVGITSLAITA